MSHEISNVDQVVLDRNPAWHGMGIIVKDVSPSQALKIGGLDWDINLEPTTWKDSLTGEDNSTGYSANIRSDTNECFGVFKNYQPVQNRELAAFAEDLAEGDDKVIIESAGSIRRGRKVWFLLKGESFSVRGRDEVMPYIMLANSHDGSGLGRVIPTTIRTVCSNTYHAALSRAGSMGYSFKHTGDIGNKLEEAKMALSFYGKAIKETQETFAALAGKTADADQLQKFFLEAYSKDFGAIASNPQNKKEEKQRVKAQEAYLVVEKNFERDLQIAGPTFWNAANAYTEFVQYRKRRGKDDWARKVNRMDSQFFGEDAKRTVSAFELALAS